MKNQVTKKPAKKSVYILTFALILMFTGVIYVLYMEGSSKSTKEQRVFERHISEAYFHAMQLLFFKNEDAINAGEYLEWERLDSGRATLYATEKYQIYGWFDQSGITPERHEAISKAEERKAINRQLDAFRQSMQYFEDNINLMYFAADSNETYFGNSNEDADLFTHHPVYLIVHPDFAVISSHAATDDDLGYHEGNRVANVDRARVYLAFTAEFIDTYDDNASVQPYVLSPNNEQLPDTVLIQEPSSLEAGTDIPFPYEFNATDLYGNAITEKSLGEKDVFFVHLWATWCPPCIDEMPDLGELARAHGDRVGFLGLLLDYDNISSAINIIESSGIPDTFIIIDAYTPGLEDLLVMLDSGFVPTTVLLSADGASELLVGAYGMRYSEHLVKQSS